MKRLGLKFIYLMRQLFADTPVQKWSVTSYLYQRFFSLLYRDQDVQTEYKGVRLILPTKDITIVPSILGGYFESYELDLFGSISKESKQVIDVGGNVGLFSILAAKSMPRGGIVHSFEPVPENISYLRKNIALNKSKKIKVIPKALGAKEGTLELFLSDRNIGTHSASRSLVKNQKSLSIETTTLDIYSQKHNLKPDLVKIDVEGYDGYVLDGGTSMFKKYRPTIFIEYAPLTLSRCNYPADKFLKKLFTIHSTVYIFEEKTNKLRPTNLKELLSLEIACNRNLLFVTNENHVNIIKKYL